MTVPARRSPDGLLRCAIYTRKSSEEGLEQDFNSLHAQREACEAYVQSQRHEGWRLLRPDSGVRSDLSDRQPRPRLRSRPTGSTPDPLDRYAYDDGGLSGGTMNRPGLRKLLADVEAGRIDVVVVYKVDRLTRSLADFARIVDVFDRAGVSFVSVTQAFNTTSSMGRLTLNVLLSFAQFEREVTAERIRDKIAASKRRGIWMGGHVPLGYRADGRRLVPQTGSHDEDGTGGGQADEVTSGTTARAKTATDEVATVRAIFETYARTGSLHATADELDRSGLRTRVRRRSDGTTIGGVVFSTGALSAILCNRVYVGEIGHKGEWHAGEHAGLIEPDLFERVQAMLADARPKRRNGRVAGGAAPNRAPLAGRIFDATGRAMVPTHTNKKGVRYRYYQTSAKAGSGADGKCSRTDRNDANATVSVKRANEAVDKAVMNGPRRVSAPVIEDAIAQALRMRDEGDPARHKPLRLDRADGGAGDVAEALARVRRVDVGADGVTATLFAEGQHARDRSGADGCHRVDEGNETLGRDEVLERYEAHRSERSDRNGEGDGRESVLHVPIEWKHRPRRAVHEPDPDADEVVRRQRDERDRKARTRVVEAIARAYGWYERLRAGEVRTLAELAASEGRSERSVRLNLPLAWLAPDIVDAALDGRLDPSIGVTALARSVTPDWTEQRRLVGLR